MLFPLCYTSCRSPVVSLYRALAVEARQRQHYSQEPNGNIASQPITQNNTCKMEETLPKVTERPELTPVTVPSGDCQFIVFDLETTGLTPDSDICQIAAMKAQPGPQAAAESVWSIYLLPSRSIDKNAQKTTGLTTEHYHGQKCLCLHGVPVDAQPYEEGIRSFYTYLQKQSVSNKHTVLVGYGSEKLDVPVLINNFKQYGISSQDLEGLIAGFSDALYLIRKMRDEDNSSLVKDGLPLISASLSGVYSHLFNTQLRDAHNATADTKALHRILFQSRLNVTPSQLLSHSLTVSSAYAMSNYTSTYLACLNSMKGKLFNYGDKPKLWVTRYVATKMARSGICYDDLARIFKEHGPNGINVLLTGPCGGSARRVTSDQKIVEAVIQHFQSLPD